MRSRNALNQMRSSWSPVIEQLLAELRDLPWTVLVNALARSALVPTLVRIALYRAAGLGIEWGAAVAPGVRIRGRHLRIGGGSTINAECLFDCRVPVTIGRNCGIGFRVQFITTSHATSDPRARAGVAALNEIRVGDGVWIGSGAVVLPGVSIGDGVVVAAGAVVKEDCPPHRLYGGVPARELRLLPVDAACH